LRPASWPYRPPLGKPGTRGDHLADPQAAWRRRPASAKQLHVLRRWGLLGGRSNPTREEDGELNGVQLAMPFDEPGLAGRLGRGLPIPGSDALPMARLPDVP